MRFADLISDIEVVAAVGTGRRALLKRGIQNKLYQYAASYDWPHYRTRGTLQTVNDYTTGTVTATNASKTITGSSTVFTATMVGRKFRVSGEAAWYDIAAFVSTTELTLTQAYQGTTASGSSFIIFQDEYKLDADVHKLLNLRQVETGLVMVGMTYGDFDDRNPRGDTLDNPTFFTLLGRQDDRYTTGTISVTASNRTLTGTSTVWTSVPGLTKGSRISLDDTDEVFTVQQVVSDTSITVYELPVTTDASTTYRVFLNNLMVQVGAVPDAQRNLYYRYQRIPYPLVNDEDEPDLPREYHYGMTSAGLAVAYRILGNETAALEADTQWKEWIALQIMQIGHGDPALSFPRTSVDAHLGMLSGPRLGPGVGYPVWL